jgi:hypothetical protein
MKTYTTKAYAEAYAKLTEEQLRSGKLEHEARTVSNESGAVEVNLTGEEIDDYHMVYDASDEEIDSDVITGENMDRLVHFLSHTDRLEPEQSDREKPDADDLYVRGMAVVQKYGDRNAVLLGGTWFYVDEPAGTSGMFTAHKQDQFASLSTATDIMEELGIALGSLELSEDDDDIPVIYEEARVRYVAMLDALETIAAGNSDPDDMVRLAVNALK